MSSSIGGTPRSNLGANLDKVESDNVTVTKKEENNVIQSYVIDVQLPPGTRLSLLSGYTFIRVVVKPGKNTVAWYLAQKQGRETRGKQITCSLLHQDILGDLSKDSRITTSPIRDIITALENTSTDVPDTVVRKAFEESVISTAIKVSNCAKDVLQGSSAQMQASYDINTFAGKGVTVGDTKTPFNELTDKQQCCITDLIKALSFDRALEFAQAQLLCETVLEGLDQPANPLSIGSAGAAAEDLSQTASDASIGLSNLFEEGSVDSGASGRRGASPGAISLEFNSIYQASKDNFGIKKNIQDQIESYQEKIESKNFGDLDRLIKPYEEFQVIQQRLQTANNLVSALHGTTSSSFSVSTKTKLDETLDVINTFEGEQLNSQYLTPAEHKLQDAIEAFKKDPLGTGLSNKILEGQIALDNERTEAFAILQAKITEWSGFAESLSKTEMIQATFAVGYEAQFCSISDVFKSGLEAFLAAKQTQLTSNTEALISDRKERPPFVPEQLEASIVQYLQDSFLGELMPSKERTERQELLQNILQDGGTNNLSVQEQFVKQCQLARPIQLLTQLDDMRQHLASHEKFVGMYRLSDQQALRDLKNQVADMCLELERDYQPGSAPMTNKDFKKYANEAFSLASSIEKELQKAHIEIPEVHESPYKVQWQELCSVIPFAKPFLTQADGQALSEILAKADQLDEELLNSLNSCLYVCANQTCDNFTNQLTKTNLINKDSRATDAASALILKQSFCNARYDHLIKEFLPRTTGDNEDVSDKVFNRYQVRLNELEAEQLRVAVEEAKNNYDAFNRGDADLKYTEIDQALLEMVSEDLRKNLKEASKMRAILSEQVNLIDRACNAALERLEDEEKVKNITDKLTQMLDRAVTDFQSLDWNDLKAELTFVWNVQQTDVVVRFGEEQDLSDLYSDDDDDDEGEVSGWIPRDTTTGESSPSTPRESDKSRSASPESSISQGAPGADSSPSLSEAVNSDEKKPRDSNSTTNALNPSIPEGEALAAPLSPTADSNQSSSSEQHLGTPQSYEKGGEGNLNKGLPLSNIEASNQAGTSYGHQPGATASSENTSPLEGLPTNEQSDVASSTSSSINEPQGDPENSAVDRDPLTVDTSIPGTSPTSYRSSSPKSTASVHNEYVAEESSPGEDSVGRGMPNLLPFSNRETLPVSENALADTNAPGASAASPTNFDHWQDAFPSSASGLSSPLSAGGNEGSPATTEYETPRETPIEESRQQAQSAPIKSGTSNEAWGMGKTPEDNANMSETNSPLGSEKGDAPLSPSEAASVFDSESGSFLSPNQRSVTHLNPDNSGVNDSEVTEIVNTWLRQNNYDRQQAALAESPPPKTLNDGTQLQTQKLKQPAYNSNLRPGQVSTGASGNTPAKVATAFKSFFRK